MNWRRLEFSIPFLPERDQIVHIRVPDPGVIATACVAIAGVLALATDIGEGADISFYATVAQVIPVFLLALMIEVRSWLDRSFDFAVGEIEARTDEYEDVRALEDRVRAHGVAIPGEAGSLAALAIGHGTTFYLCLGVLSLVAMVVLYI